MKFNDKEKGALHHRTMGQQHHPKPHHPKDWDDGLFVLSAESATQITLEPFSAPTRHTRRPRLRERMTQITLATQPVSGKEVAANNRSRKEVGANKSALRQYINGNSMVDLILYFRRKLAETCTRPQSLCVCTVYGGGDGSGLGCLLLERISKQQSLSPTQQSCACTPRVSTRISP